MMPRMESRARAIVGVVVTLLGGPGAGAGLVGRYGLMLVWIAASAGALIACTLSGSSCTDAHDYAYRGRQFAAQNNF